MSTVPQPGIIRAKTDSSGFRVLEPDGAGNALKAETGALVLVDPTDNTKVRADDISNQSTGVTRTTTWPDASVSFLTTPGNIALTDPGTGNAIPVTQSGFLPITIGTGAETNTLAAPVAVGQTLGFSVAADGGGSRAITAAGAINANGDTIMTFADVTDTIILTAMAVGGSLLWRVTHNDGVALS